MEAVLKAALEVCGIVGIGCGKVEVCGVVGIGCGKGGFMEVIRVDMSYVHFSCHLCIASHIEII